ncbi:hypothetical protein Bca4012_064794 [Brassica carinata]
MSLSSLPAASYPDGSDLSASTPSCRRVKRVKHSLLVVGLNWVVLSVVVYCIAAAVGRVCVSRRDLSCWIIKSGFVGWRGVLSVLVEVDVIVRWDEGHNDKSRSEAVASLAYYYHGGFGICLCSCVCILALLSCQLPQSGF